MAAAVPRPCPSRTPDPLRRDGPWWAVALLALLTTLGAGLPGIGPDDRRTRVDQHQMPWAALARLQIPGVSRCTAFLIDPQTAVTVAHCLYSRRVQYFVLPESVHVLVGYDAGTFTRHAVAASFQVAPGYDPEEGAVTRGLDLAIIRLAAPVALPGQTLGLALDAAPRGTPLMLGGYGQDRAEVVLADTACQSDGYTDGETQWPVLVHTCAGTRGTSGAPVLARDMAGVWQVVGVQATGRVDGVGGTAVPATAVRALLREPPR